MFASLRFPVAPVEETLLPFGADGKVLQSLSLTQEQKDALSVYLCRACPDPSVLEYRSEFAAELLESPDLQALFTDFSALADLPEPPEAMGSQGETVRLRVIARFETFSARFDAFCARLDGVVPESNAAKRCLRFLRSYRDRYEYKELKHKAADLLRTFSFEKGVDCHVGELTGEGTALLLPPRADGLVDGIERLSEEFGCASLPPCTGSERAYTETEAAVLTAVIRADALIARRMEEFFTLYEACGTEDIFRLCEEAAYFTAMNVIYTEGRRAGYPVCRPVLRAPGFYTEIFGLGYPTAQKTVAKADFVTSPLDHVTVVCGPDAIGYLEAVGFAHRAACAGGLVFAERAEISPINRLERDETERLRVEGLTENGLCLCSHLFDAMLPRQEEAAAERVLISLCEKTVRSVLRICSKSNLTALQNCVRDGKIPPCSFLQAGNDRTLEELLLRHRLTADALADEASANGEEKSRE